MNPQLLAVTFTAPLLLISMLLRKQTSTDAVCLPATDNAYFFSLTLHSPPLAPTMQTDLTISPKVHTNICRAKH